MGLLSVQRKVHEVQLVALNAVQVLKHFTPVDVGVGQLLKKELFVDKFQVSWPIHLGTKDDRVLALFDMLPIYFIEKWMQTNFNLF